MIFVYFYFPIEFTERKMPFWQKQIFNMINEIHFFSLDYCIVSYTDNWFSTNLTMRKNRPDYDTSNQHRRETLFVRLHYLNCARIFAYNTLFIKWRRHKPFEFGCIIECAGISLFLLFHCLVAFCRKKCWEKNYENKHESLSPHKR